MVLAGLQAGAARCSPWPPCPPAWGLVGPTLWAPSGSGSRPSCPRHAQVCIRASEGKLSRACGSAFGRHLCIHSRLSSV